MEYKRKRLIRAALQKAEAKRKQTVRQAESAANTEQKTPEEYAQTVVSEKAAQAAENLQSKALDTGRISYRQFRILQEKRQRVPTRHAAQPAETEKFPLAQSADRREISKRQRFRQRAPDQREIKTPDSYRDKMQALKTPTPHARNGAPPSAKAGGRHGAWQRRQTARHSPSLSRWEH